MAKGSLADLAVDKDKGGASAEEDAAQDLIDAIKSGSAKATSLALSRHYELCAGKKEEADEGEEY